MNKILAALAANKPSVWAASGFACAWMATEINDAVRLGMPLLAVAFHYFYIHTGKPLLARSFNAESRRRAIIVARLAAVAGAWIGLCVLVKWACNVQWSNSWQDALGSDNLSINLIITLAITLLGVRLNTLVPWQNLRKVFL